MDNKRFNMLMPRELYDRMERLVQENPIFPSVTSLIIRFIRIGLLILQTQNEGGKILIQYSDGKIREIVFL